MIERRAILIQSVVEYIAYLKEPLNYILRTEFQHLNINIDEALQWIIEEELELVFLVFAIGHIHNHQIFSVIHNRLSCSATVLPLSTLTLNFIKVPLIYDNNAVEIKLTKHDLIIKYKTRNRSF